MESSLLAGKSGNTAAVSAVDEFRLSQLKHLAGLKSFSKSWGVWEPKIREIVGPTPTGASIYELGARLSEVFRSNKVEGRDNSAVSAGGTAWECLVAWYLNLGLYGTGVVVIRPHAKFMPKAISDALSVTISNHSTNTESDLVAFNIDLQLGNRPLTLEEISNVIRDNPMHVDLSVIQCKTNWNDNAQIPMLWDLIYASETFRIPNVSVGINGIRPGSFRRFSYAFVSVPTSRGNFESKSLSVLRVANLTGGNFWGRSTKAGTAKALNEFFSINFGQHFTGTIQSSIENNVLKQPDVLEGFLSLKF